MGEGIDRAPGAARVRAGRSARQAVWAWGVLAHVIAGGLVLTGAWPAALLLAGSAHLLVWWGTLVPGSAMLVPVLRRIDGADDAVWLTIDDGPSDDTEALLDLLDAHGARATFFLVGRRALARPGLVRAILARGHAVGNHTFSHPAAWFWALPPAAIARQIGDAQQALSDICGHPPQLFRAAVGMANPFVAPALARHRLHYVGWSARAFDAVRGDPEAVWSALAADIRPGAIVLLHEGAAHGRSVDILARVLAGIRARGLRCVLPERPEAPRTAE